LLADASGHVVEVWGFFGGGCHPNRDTLDAIEAAGFHVEDVERFDEPGALLAKPRARVGVEPLIASNG
jgi:hypothetical protein